MKIDKGTVEHVAKLSRLGLLPEEIDLFAGQLSNIIGFAETINKLDTKNVPPTFHSIPMKNVMREDKVEPFVHQDLIMRNAPEEEAGMFKVPKILE